MGSNLFKSHPYISLMSQWSSRLELHSLAFFDKISTKQGIHKYGTYGMLSIFHGNCQIADKCTEVLFRNN